MRRFRGSWPWVMLLSMFCTELAAAPDDALIKAIRTDPSFKVRMQAIRLLTKQIDEGGLEKTPRQREALEAATKDPDHLVRGMACYSLGLFRDPMARASLEAATKDAEEFVRRRAVAALALLDSQTNDTDLAISWSVELLPSIRESGVQELLSASVESAGRKYVTGDRLMVAPNSEVKGYRLLVTLAELTKKSTADGGTRVDAVVKCSVMTWPDKNLRHVFTAKAGASHRGNEAAVGRVVRAVLTAAADKAVRDGIDQIRQDNP